MKSISTNIQGISAQARWGKIQNVIPRIVTHGTRNPQTWLCGMGKEFEQTIEQQNTKSEITMSRARFDLGKGNKLKYQS